LLARFLQGIGAAGTRVIALSVVRDTHSGRGMAATMSMVMMVFMVVPVFAPMIGQVIILAGDWHLIFLFMAPCRSLSAPGRCCGCPKPCRSERRRPLTLKSVSEAFTIILTNRVALFYTLATAFYFGSLVRLPQCRPADLCRHLRAGVPISRSPSRPSLWSWPARPLSIHGSSAALASAGCPTEP
jgi:MFS family permease